MSLKNSASTGIKWSSATQVARVATQWVSVAVLARLLAPSDFGLVSIAMVVIGFVAVFKDLGTSAAVIQRKNLSESLLSSLFWVNAGFGLMATFAIILISPLVGTLYREPEITPLLMLLSLTFFFSGLGTIQQAILERKLEFNKIAKVEIFATVLGAIVGVVSALSGYGARSLVYQVIVTTLTTTVLLWIFCKWKPRVIFHFNEVKSVSSFSLNLTGFTIFNYYFARNADNLLIGYFIGAEALGYYNLAYRLMLFPLLNVTYVINRVVLPVYSQIQDDNTRFRNVFLKITGAVAFITFPMMIGMIALREPVINVIFGTKWSPVILLILILAPVGMVQSIMSTTGVIYIAKSRTDWMFRWGMVTGILTVISFITGLKWGIVGVAIAYSVVTAIIAYPSFAIPFKLIGLPVRGLAFVLWRPLFSGIVMLACVSALKVVIPSALPGWFTLGALVAFGITIYLLVSLLINRGQVKTVLDVLKARV